MGIDTGKTAAVACLDLDGKVSKLATGRFAGLEWFVDTIREAGSPVIIAADKKSPDSLVEKLAAIFDAVLFLPQADISVMKKKELTARRFANLHERDALAAAATAYNAYAGKLRQAERIAKESNAEPEGVKSMVIRKYSVDEAIKKREAGRRFVRSMHG